MEYAIKYFKKNYVMVFVNSFQIYFKNLIFFMKLPHYLNLNIHKKEVREKGFNKLRNILVNMKLFGQRNSIIMVQKNFVIN